MPARLIDLRYAAACATCGVHLSVGTKAWWDGDTKHISCQSCTARPEAEAAADGFSVKARPMPEPGVAGASARAEYERRHKRREQRVAREHPRLARLLLAASKDPQSTEAWAKGAEGEERVAASLDRLTTCGAAVLHDRQMPGSRANIDHVVIAPSGVWVVDAKRYNGKLQRRDRGFSVASRDCSKLLAAMSKQVAAVKRALDGEDIPIHPVLCFTGTEWSLLARPFVVDGVLVTWPRALVRTISRAADRHLAVSEICERLSARLPSVRSAQSSGP